MADSIDRFFSEWAAQGLRSNWPPALPDDIQFIYRNARMSKLLGDRLDSTCQRHGLTRSQFEVMAVLRRHDPEPLSAGDLMNAAFLTSGSVTSLLDQLQQKGWIVRQPTPGDRRRLDVRLTPEGIRIIEPAVIERISDNSQIASLVPPELRANINQAMREILSILESSTSNQVRS